MGTNPVNTNNTPTIYSEDICPVADPRGVATSDGDNFDLASAMNFESGSTADLMSLWKYSWRAGRDHAFQIVEDPVMPSNHVARFEVREGDYAGDFDRVPNEDGILTSRSEIREKFEAEMGQTYWYSFRTFIPEDFPIEDNRLVIAQWHASDSEGEATSPPLAVYYRNGELKISVRHSNKETISKDDEVTKINLYRQKDFPRGKWHDFVFQVKWSYQSDGFVNAWVDGEQVAQYKGAVGYNDEDGPYFKFGAYRDEEYIVEDAAGHKTKIKATDPYVI